MLEVPDKFDKGEVLTIAVFAKSKEQALEVYKERQPKMFGIRKMFLGKPKVVGFIDKPNMLTWSKLGLFECNWEMIE